MSINISISVPTGFASNESGAPKVSTSALTINGNELIQQSAVTASLTDNTALVKRIDDLEAIIKNINTTPVSTKDDSNIKQINDHNLTFEKRLNDIDTMIKTINSKKDNASYIEDKFHETDKYVVDLKKCCVNLSNDYTKLHEYTNNLENKLKSLEEYTQKLEQRLNQEVKKVEAIVVHAVLDSETIDIESVVSVVSVVSESNVTDTSTAISDVAEEDKVSVVEEIDNIDSEEGEEVVEETEEEEEGMAVEEFEYKGKTYYRDEDNFVYEMSEEGELSEALGVWNTATEKIRFYAKK